MAGAEREDIRVTGWARTEGRKERDEIGTEFSAENYLFGQIRSESKWHDNLY
jgi:hypothetical protein